MVGRGTPLAVLTNSSYPQERIQIAQDTPLVDGGDVAKTWV